MGPLSVEDIFQIASFIWNKESTHISHFFSLLILVIAQSKPFYTCTPQKKFTRLCFSLLTQHKSSMQNTFVPLIVKSLHARSHHLRYPRTFTTGGEIGVLQLHIYKYI